MEKRSKRVRGSNWNHAQTMALAELKREASLNKEDGRLVWERIAHSLSSRFPGQMRTGAQCRRRWDTLVKIYNHIENYCVETGQDHRELDADELSSMKLDTAYDQDWYDIVEQVCSQRKRKESCDRDLRLSKQTKGSSTGSHRVELPEHPPNTCTLCSPSTSQSVTRHEQSTPEWTSTYARVPFSPSLEDKLGPEEEFLRFMNGTDALTQWWQHGQVYHEVSQEPQTSESANQLPFTLPVENGAQLWEPPQYDWWDLIEFVPSENSTEIEQPKEESKMTEPCYQGLKSGEKFKGRPKKPLQDHVRDDSPLRAAGNKKMKEAGSVTLPYLPACYSNSYRPYSLPYDGPDWQEHVGAHSLPPLYYGWSPRRYDGCLYADGLGYLPRNNLPSADIESSSDSVNQDELISSATMTSSTSSRSSDSTTSRQSRRWSLKAILLNILPCCHPRRRK